MQRLRNEDHYEVDERRRQVIVNEDGVAFVENALGVENMYDHAAVDLVHHLDVALKAKELYNRDVEYLLVDGEVKIVDEFTGRVLEGRRYSEGLHQAIEAKEGVRIKEENQTLATITLQNYFRMYEKLSGMTGTAKTEAAEFKEIYDLEVVVVPTNVPIARMDQGDLIYKSEDAKFDARTTYFSNQLMIKYDLMLALIGGARDEDSVDLAKQAKTICSEIARKDITYRDIRAKRREVDELLRQLTGE